MTTDTIVVEREIYEGLLRIEQAARKVSNFVIFDSDPCFAKVRANALNALVDAVDGYDEQEPAK